MALNADVPLTTYTLTMSVYCVSFVCESMYMYECVFCIATYRCQNLM